jgi:gliding motility-associated-like protein
VVGNRNETSYSILSNKGGLNFTSASNSTDQATRNIYTGDLDGDGKPDLAFTSLQLPTGSFSIQTVRNTNCYTPEFLNEAPIALCPGQNVTLEVPDATGVTFSWTKDAADLGLSTPSIVATAPGVYEVRAISEGGSCDLTASFTINNGAGTVPTTPVASNDGPSCAGQIVNLAVNSQAGATYLWNGPNGFTSTNQNPVISNISQNQAGFYTVLVKVGDCLSSEAETEVVVNEVESFSITTTDPTTACAGSIVNLATQNRAGFTYAWLKNGASTGSSGTTFAANSAGTYSVAVTDTNTTCTVTSNEIVVSILSAPVASFTVTSPICTGIDAVFTNTSTVDVAATPIYTWDFDDGTVINSTNSTHVFTTANTFNVSLNIEYSGIGCTNLISQPIVVTAAAPVVISSTTDVICTGTPIDLTASGTFASLNWSSGETVASITIDTPNTYTVTATDNNGCVSTDQIDIIEGIVPVLTILGNNIESPLTVPSGTSVQLIADGADSYLWTPSDFLSDPNISNPVSDPNSNITYTIEGALIDGCTSTAEFTIAILAVLEEIDISPAKAFAPDNIEDQFWQIESVENYPDCSLSIFDERGSLVFREIGYNNTWDGTNAGSPLPEGVYYYVFSCPSLKPRTGSVLLIRF